MLSIKFVLGQAAFFRAARMVLCFAFVAKPVLVTQQRFVVAEQCKTLFLSSTTETGSLGMGKWLGGENEDSRAQLTRGISHQVGCSAIKAQGRRKKGH